MNNQWKQFKRRITVNASVKQVYDFWTTQKYYESWFLRSAQFFSKENIKRKQDEVIQNEDSYIWKWYGHENFETQGKILELNGKDLIKFTFEGCIVTVRVLEEKGQTILELTQSEIPLEENPDKNLHVQCSNGWTFYMANFKSIIEGGIDLRNKVDSLNVVNS